MQVQLICPRQLAPLDKLALSTGHKMPLAPKAGVGICHPYGFLIVQPVGSDRRCLLFTADSDTRQSRQLHFGLTWM
jgi:hypothetical protein